MKNGSHRRLALIARPPRPVRKVVTRSGSIPRGFFPSLKNGRMVAYEQLLEADACLLFEMSPRIRRYREQPARVWFPDDDHIHRYTFDYELELTDGRYVFVEIKPEKQLRRPEVRRRMDLIQAYMSEQETPFLVLTDDAIRQQPRLKNLRVLWRDAPLHSPTDDFLLHITRQLILERISAFGALKSRINRGTALALFTRGYATCSLASNVTNDTPISLSQEKDHVWFQLAPRFGF